MGCVYRFFDDYLFYNKFYILFEYFLRNRKNVVIFGDLNLDLIIKGYEGRRLFRIFGSLDFYNVIKDFIRIIVIIFILFDFMIIIDVFKIMLLGMFDLGFFDYCFIYGIIRL